MGEVCRATDTKLGREVANKLQPAQAAQDPERLTRFEREAKLLASLDHPNVAHVYGLENATQEDGSRQIAEALEEAHALARGFPRRGREGTALAWRGQDTVWSRDVSVQNWLAESDRRR
jgi:serine/threonine protein kinase